MTYYYDKKLGYKINIYFKQLEKQFTLVFRYTITNYLIYNPSNIKRQALNSLKMPV